MKKILIFCLCLSSVLLSFAQHGNIGIGTANPDSSSKLDIQSIDKGLLIPRIALVSVDSTAPISAPALSLLIFNTTTNLELSPGFYFWDGNLWQKLSTANSTLGLDEAYDGNGAGAGRIIEADQGAVSIEGEDGFQVLGSLNLGAEMALSGAGTRMFFNPRKSAFRVGTVTSAQWDKDSLGLHSVAMGYNTLALGSFSNAMGLGSKARGFAAISFGNSNEANNTGSVAIGTSNKSSGLNSIALGNNNTVTGGTSLAMGYNNKLPSSISYALGSDLETFSIYETVLGRFNTSYSPNSSLAWHPNDRLLTLGNGTSAANKSDALIIYKNGDTRIFGTVRLGSIASNFSLPAVDGNSDQILVNNGSGALVWQDQTDKSNTLDAAYDEGGPGQGRSIIADNGAVSITGTDGFQIIGIHGSGETIQVSGAGTRMFFNPNKSALRAGRVIGNNWDADSIGNYSIALGYNNLAKGTNSISLGASNEAQAVNSICFGLGNIASEQGTGSFGNYNNSSGYFSHSFGNYNEASGSYSSCYGYNNTATGLYAMSLGYYSNSFGDFATSLGSFNTSSGNSSTAMGIENVAGAYAATATGYGSSAFGAQSFSMGQYTVAVGTNAIASGNSSSAIGSNSFAGGNFGNAGGENAFAFGDSCFADGEASFALGKNAYATGNYASSIGYNNTASFDGTVSLGYSNSATSPYASSFGLGNVSSGNSATSYGRYNTASGNYSISAGVSNEAIGTSSISMGYNNIANSSRSICIGSSNQSSNNYALSIGLNNQTQGEQSVSIGSTNLASGDFSYAIGTNNYTAGSQSFSIGHNNNAYANSLCLGSDNLASGNRSFTFGKGLIASSFNEVVVGCYNTPDPNPSAGWETTDNIFVVGNGVSALNTSNALVVRKRGTVGIQMDNPVYALNLPNNSDIDVGRARANAWTTYSDRRIKSNIQELSYGLQTILKLKPVSYFQHDSEENEKEIVISESGTPQIGFIAQDLYEEVPEAVDKPSNEEIELWGVDYTKIIPVLVKAIQEQQEEINYLKSLIENQ